MQDVIVRQATSEEIPALVAVIHAGFEEYRERLNPPSGAHKDTIESVQKKLMTASAGIAIVDERMVGCIICEPRADHLYLGRLAVLPSHRRYGIGKKLIVWGEARARELGYNQTQLHVRLALQNNMSYFEHLGYRVLSYACHPGFSEPTYATLGKEIG
jgi:predicted N-acetyltransferase YhbS